MTIINPPIGKFINWHRALVGDPAMSAAFGAPMVKTFNHLRRFRAMEYIASYSGRCNYAINGNDSNVFHVISRFPVRKSGDDATAIITSKQWRRGYGSGSETWEWYKDIGDVAVDKTLYSAGAASATVTDDTAASHANGPAREFSVDVEPVAIGTDDGFRCSRLEISNAMLHRLNIFGCPLEPDLSNDEALIGLADISVGRVLQGWDEANSDDGTIGTLCHYMDGDSSDVVTGTDSVIHNTARALFNTPYALGVHLNDEAALISIRQDSSGNAMTYKVKARNLTGGVGDVVCDIAIVISGDAAARIKLSSATAGDSAVYTIPGGGLANPTLVTSSSFVGTNHANALGIDPDGDTITIEALSGAGNDFYIQAVSLWEPYQHR